MVTAGMGFVFTPKGNAVNDFSNWKTANSENSSGPQGQQFPQPGPNGPGKAKK